MREITVYRLSGWDSPFWVSPNRSPGRYNRLGAAPTQYVCLHPHGPWAEYMRRDGIASIDQANELAARIWVGRLGLPRGSAFGMNSEDPRFLDLTFDNATEFDLEPGDLIDDDHSACQAFADRCREQTDGPRVLSVPNAALPYTRNLVILGPRLAVKYAALQWDEEIDIPTAIVADKAIPPAEVLTQIRHLGVPHHEYEQWRSKNRASRSSPGSQPG